MLKTTHPLTAVHYSATQRADPGEPTTQICAPDQKSNPRPFAWSHQPGQQSFQVPSRGVYARTEMNTLLPSMRKSCYQRKVIIWTNSMVNNVVYLRSGVSCVPQPIVVTNSSFMDGQLVIGHTRDTLIKKILWISLPFTVTLHEAKCSIFREI